MTVGKLVAWCAAGLLVFVCFVGGMTVVGWKLHWWLAKSTVNHEVNIQNHNTGTQTAWHNEVERTLGDVLTLPEGSPQRAALVRQACDLIPRLDNDYKTPAMASFYGEEC